MHEGFLRHRSECESTVLPWWLSPFDRHSRLRGSLETPRPRWRRPRPVPCGRCREARVRSQAVESPVTQMSHAMLPALLAHPEDSGTAQTKVDPGAGSEARPGEAMAPYDVEWLRMVQRSPSSLAVGSHLAVRQPGRVREARSRLRTGIAALRGAYREWCSPEPRGIPVMSKALRISTPPTPGGDAQSLDPGPKLEHLRDVDHGDPLLGAVFELTDRKIRDQVKMRAPALTLERLCALCAGMIRLPCSEKLAPASRVSA